MWQCMMEGAEYQEHLVWARGGQGLASKRADAQSPSSPNQKALQPPTSDQWSITTLRSLDISGNIPTAPARMDAEDSPWGGLYFSLRSDTLLALTFLPG